MKKYLTQNIRRGWLTPLLAMLILLLSGQTYAESLMKETRKELAEARSATAGYHNISAAYAAGYQNVHFEIPGVGCHLMNFSLVDEVFNISEPELLIYSDCDAAQPGQAKLRAIEYVTSCHACSEVPAPEGFTGDDDVWSIFPDNTLWTLHVWTWKHNPNGIFVKVNPRYLPE